MFKYLFILLFLTSSCSLYDFSDSKSIIDDILGGENIILIAPSTEVTLSADNIALEAFIQDRFGIKTITITPSIGSGPPIIINPVGNPKRYGISQNFLVKNDSAYNTSHGKYTIKISYENNEDKIIEKDFIINIKLLSVDYTFEKTTTINNGFKPTSDTWEGAGIHIRDLLTGAPIKSIKIEDSLGSYVTNTPFIDSLASIRMDEISGGVLAIPTGTISMNVSIISDTGGISTESITLLDRP